MGSVVLMLIEPLLRGFKRMKSGSDAPAIGISMTADFTDANLSMRIAR